MKYFQGIDNCWERVYNISVTHFLLRTTCGKTDTADVEPMAVRFYKKEVKIDGRNHYFYHLRCRCQLVERTTEKYVHRLTDKHPVTEWTSYARLFRSITFYFLSAFRTSIIPCVFIHSTQLVSCVAFRTNPIIPLICSITIHCSVNTINYKYYGY